MAILHPRIALSADTVDLSDFKENCSKKIADIDLVTSVKIVFKFSINKRRIYNNIYSIKIL